MSREEIASFLLKHDWNGSIIKFRKPFEDFLRQQFDIFDRPFVIEEQNRLSLHLKSFVLKWAHHVSFLYIKKYCKLLFFLERDKMLSLACCIEQMEV